MAPSGVCTLVLLYCSLAITQCCASRLPPSPISQSEAANTNNRRRKAASDSLPPPSFFAPQQCADAPYCRASGVTDAACGDITYPTSCARTVVVGADGGRRRKDKRDEKDSRGKGTSDSLPTAASISSTLQPPPVASPQQTQRTPLPASSTTKGDESELWWGALRVRASPVTSPVSPTIASTPMTRVARAAASSQTSTVASTAAMPPVASTATTTSAATVTLTITTYDSVACQFADHDLCADDSLGLSFRVACPAFCHACPTSSEVAPTPTQTHAPAVTTTTTTAAMVTTARSRAPNTATTTPAATSSTSFEPITTTATTTPATSSSNAPFTTPTTTPTATPTTTPTTTFTTTLVLEATSSSSPEPITTTHTATTSPFVITSGTMPSDDNDTADNGHASAVVGLWVQTQCPKMCGVCANTNNGNDGGSGGSSGDDDDNVDTTSNGNDGGSGGSSGDDDDNVDGSSGSGSGLELYGNDDNQAEESVPTHVGDSYVGGMLTLDFYKDADTSKDGQLTIQEVAARGMYKSFFNLIDGDGNGRVSMVEFDRWTTFMEEQRLLGEEGGREEEQEEQEQDQDQEQEANEDTEGTINSNGRNDFEYGSGSGDDDDNAVASGGGADDDDGHKQAALHQFDSKRYVALCAASVDDKVCSFVAHSMCNGNRLASTAIQNACPNLCGICSVRKPTTPSTTVPTSSTSTSTATSTTAATTITDTATSTTVTATTTTIYDPGNVDCLEKQDPCTAACEAADARNYEVTTAVEKKGRVCNGPSDCMPGDGACPTTTTTGTTSPYAGTTASTAPTATVIAVVPTELIVVLHVDCESVALADVERATVVGLVSGSQLNTDDIMSANAGCGSVIVIVVVKNPELAAAAKASIASGSVTVVVNNVATVAFNVKETNDDDGGSYGSSSSSMCDATPTVKECNDLDGCTWNPCSVTVDSTSCVGLAGLCRFSSRVQTDCPITCNTCDVCKLDDVDSSSASTSVALFTSTTVTTTSITSTSRTTTSFTRTSTTKTTTATKVAAMLRINALCDPQNDQCAYELYCDSFAYRCRYITTPASTSTSTTSTTTKMSEEEVFNITAAPTAAPTTAPTSAPTTNPTTETAMATTIKNSTAVAAFEKTTLKGGAIFGIVVGVLVLLGVLFCIVAGFTTIDGSKVSQDDGLGRVHVHNVNGRRWNQNDNDEAGDLSSPFPRPEEVNEVEKSGDGGNGGANPLRATRGVQGVHGETPSDAGWKSWMTPGSALQTHTRATDFQEYHHQPGTYNTPAKRNVPPSPRYLGGGWGSGSGGVGYNGGGHSGSNSPHALSQQRQNIHLSPQTMPFMAARSPVRGGSNGVGVSVGGGLSFNFRSEFGVKAPAAGGNEFDEFMQHLAVGKPGGAIEAAELLKAGRVNKELRVKQRRLEKALGVPGSIQQPGSTPAAVEDMDPMSHQIAASHAAGPQDATAVWTGVSSALSFASPGKTLGESVEVVHQENWRLQEDIDNLEATLGSTMEACGIVELSQRSGLHEAHDSFMAGHRAAGQLPPRKWREQQARHQEQQEQHNSYA